MRDVEDFIGRVIEKCIENGIRFKFFIRKFLFKDILKIEFISYSRKFFFCESYNVGDIFNSFINIDIFVSDM